MEKDKNETRKMIFDATVEALKQVVLPRFERLDAILDRMIGEKDSLSPHLPVDGVGAVGHEIDVGLGERAGTEETVVGGKR